MQYYYPIRCADSYIIYRISGVCEEPYRVLHILAKFGRIRTRFAIIYEKLFIRGEGVKLAGGGVLVAQDFLLIWRMKNGDEGAFDIFVRKYYPCILRYCRYHVAKMDQAEDVTQEVFLKFFGALPSYGYRGKTLNYLYTIAKNLCIDAVKQEKRYAMTELPKSDDMYQLEALASNTNNDYEWAAETRLDVANALKKLSCELYEPVVLYYFQELKVREIAQLLNISVPLVKYRLKRAREILRQYICDI